MNPQLYDTLTRQVKPLSAEDRKSFRFYCCGPTVYGPAHIGNFRTFLLQDVLRRILEISGISVEHVRNITDVDDKTIRQSQADNLSLQVFTTQWTAKFHEDCKQLNMLKPSHEPKATDHIAEQIDMIDTLVKKEHAYVSEDGSVYFKVSSFSGYGSLSRLKQEELQTQKTTSGDTSNLADEYDRDTVADFALWKAYKPEDGPNSWDSPWGPGRPGWHIECSAMSRKFLGDTFDLHGGGVDLTFPHHENEIAQSCCCTGKPLLAKHWFHSAHLMVEGAKMSKSLGNLYTLDDLKAKGYSPMAVRYALLSGHYRQSLNFTLNGLNAAKSALQKIEKETLKLLTSMQLDLSDFEPYVSRPKPGFFDTSDAPLKECWLQLIDDMNIPACLGKLFSQMPFSINDSIDKKRLLEGLGALLYTLGIQLSAESAESCIEAPLRVQELASERWAAKQSKQWDKADELRDQVLAIGWKIKDHKEGYDLEVIS